MTLPQCGTAWVHVSVRLLHQGLQVGDGVQEQQDRQQQQQQLLQKVADGALPRDAPRSCKNVDGPKRITLRRESSVATCVCV